ncbi:MAG: aminotransferase class V-fold PLP-dependent enzyme [Proteobacteria bacterium]|nr:aminotransferase class V-fold PLP-dependent enzyme [Pseudomonadota bacterium]
MASAEKFNEIRKLFPATEKLAYFDGGARSLLSLDSRKALDKLIDARIYEGGDKPAMMAMIERVREKFARLINASPDEIAFTKNVSDGLNTIAGSIPFEKGDNMVLTSDLEHPNNIYPWYNIRDRVGIEVRDVASVDGHIDVDGMIAVMDDRTRIVSCSSVTFSPGFRTDVSKLGKACREKGVFLLVDGVQSCGSLKTDVEELHVDALAVSTQKGLQGLYGMGFLYCRMAAAETLRPERLARFGVNLGDDTHEAAAGDQAFELMPGARRFEVGNYNFPGAAAVEPALDLMLELGSDAIEEWNLRLAHRLATGLHQIGLPVCGDLDDPRRTHIVTVGEMDLHNHDGAGDGELQSLNDLLMANGVVLSIRRGVLRFGIHFYNNDDDIDRVLDLARQWKDQAKAA